MKTICLFRHSMPLKNSGMENELIPLSQDGKFLMRNLIERLADMNDVHVVSFLNVHCKVLKSSVQM